MALILKEIAKLYCYLNDELSDKRTHEWFLMSSPFPGLALLGAYLYVVFEWGPAHMRDRRPYELKTPIALYNFVQILACLYVVYQSLRLGWGWGAHYDFLCQPVDHSDSPEAIEFAWKVCYFYFIIKLVDLSDTVFFVLRKKQSQVSFLHVYHHFGMVMLSWSMVKWLPGGHCSLLVLVNCAVHVLMYAYYLLTVWDDGFKKSAWWKKHVTQIQIAQFTLLLFHFCVLVVKRDCRYPMFPAVVLIPQNLFMVVLFSDFYYRTYIKKSNKAA